MRIPFHSLVLIAVRLPVHSSLFAFQPGMDQPVRMQPKRSIGAALQQCADFNLFNGSGIGGDVNKR
ncbi:hypothetical protein KNP414_00436 [Paenibacillus mucilaginosus KNP414]|uniref:Uncharacterized protein n=1 Tax=Paenibacillus mucilaginosus (strain KNP414) TaxID=1036673 RepID=F8FPB1_PAEMK|nr:hypothetical protein KNP414_00436 [Paenibacillus mucilaginosus KNP414]